MAKTEKEKRLEKSIAQALLNPQLYPMGRAILSISDVSVFIQRVFDKDGRELQDYSVLEEAQGGEITGYARIETKLYIPEDGEAKETFVYHITYCAFDILGYEDKQFLVNIHKPISIEKR